MELEAKFTLLAGNSVIKECAKLRDLGHHDSPDFEKMRSQLEATIKAMCKELLQTNLGLSEGDILRVIRQAQRPL